MTCLVFSFQNSAVRFRARTQFYRLLFFNQMKHQTTKIYIFVTAIDYYVSRLVLKYTYFFHVRFFKDKINDL